MLKATYSEQLLIDIRTGAWREPVLDLAEQKLDAVAVQQLTSTLATNSHTKTLNLYTNQIGAEGAKTLAQNTTLTSLDVSNNHLTPAEEKVIEASLARNRKRRGNWLRLVPLMAFVRANRSSAISTSFLPLVSLVAKLEDECYTDKQTYHIHLDKFFNTRFFKQQISEEKSTERRQHQPVVLSANAVNATPDMRNSASGKHEEKQRSHTHQTASASPVLAKK
jgi:hypothetical protein